jgi:hypothetical protein
MRDPDLVTRAQRAAVALERAWERWRAMHGLSAEPMPPVSSYVGYSIEEPWGRPRVVFGVDAREAELLAALLDHHECVGPFYQADPSDDALRPGSGANGASPLDQARSRIPAQAPATEARPQRWSRDAQPGPADVGPAGDGPAGDGRDDQHRYPGDRPGQEPHRENGTAEPQHQDETGGSNGRIADQRRGRRTELSRPSRRERRAASRQRSAGSREPLAGQSRADAAEQAGDGHQAEAEWPADMSGPLWSDGETAAGDGGGQASPVSEAPAADITTVDSIPVQGTAAGPAAGAGDMAGPAEGAARGKSLYDVTKASRERARKAGRDRGAAPAAGRRGTSPDLSRLRAADAGRGAKSAVEPASSNGATDAGHADAGLVPAPQDPDGLQTAAAGRAGPDPLGDEPQHGPGDPAAQDRGYPAQPGTDLADGGQRGEARWAEDTDPGLDYPGDPGLEYAGDADRDYPGNAGLEYPGDPGLEYPGNAGLDYPGDPDVGYLPDADRDYPGDESWDDLAGPDEPWGNGLAGAAGAGHDADPGRSDAAGLDQLWDIGRGPAGRGQDQAPGGIARQAQDAGRDDAAGPDLLGQDALGSAGPTTADSGAATREAGSGRAWDNGAATREAGSGRAWDNGAGAAGASFEAGLDQAADAGPVPDGGPARDTRPAREAGPARAGGSAWDIHPAREAGPDRATGPGQAADAHGGLPGDYGPDPLGVPGGRQTADFLAAPPPSSSILTAAPRQNSRTARPSVPDAGTETIAAELAGWAAGELPGQASARLAAWAAIGGVPAPGYRRPEGSGSQGVATERVR